MRFQATLLALIAFAMPSIAWAEPFAELRAAYLARDPQAAAAAYAPNAKLINRYASSPLQMFQGIPAIAGNFAQFFAGIEPGEKLDLNFRITGRKGLQRWGVYRIRVGQAAYFGKFHVQLTADGKFLRDESFDGTRGDFEEAAGPLMFAQDDEVLDPAYYDALVGRYRLSAQCDLVITRSVVRLFAWNTCTNEWRGLERRSGRQWTAGTHVQPIDPKITYDFSRPVKGQVSQIRIGRKALATRRDPYRKQDVSFVSRDGTRLAGTVYSPTGGIARKPAVVLIHGSGGQARNGYASIMALLADQLASQGRVVLIYDKRGVDGSGGDWTRANFGVLADDAIAAMAFLASRAEVDPARIGLAGSSQAGWVAAQAIRQGANPADVFLLGAAGTALTVAEQNLYNTEVMMRCANLPEADIALALAQQKAFFAFLQDPSRAAELDRLTQQGRQRTGLSDWLFPNSTETDRNAGEWYTTLDPSFDPLPIWQGYTGRALFVFSEFDDATPTSLAASRLKKSGAEVRILPGAQHLGLRTNDRCKADFASVSAFSPAMWDVVRQF